MRGSGACWARSVVVVEHVHAKKSEDQENFQDAGHLCMLSTNHRAHDRLFLSGPLSPVTRGRCALSFLQFSCGPGGFLFNRNVQLSTLILRVVRRAAFSIYDHLTHWESSRSASLSLSLSAGPSACAMQGRLLTAGPSAGPSVQCRAVCSLQGPSARCRAVCSLQGRLLNAGPSAQCRAVCTMQGRAGPSAHCSHFGSRPFWLKCGRFCFQY